MLAKDKYKGRLFSVLGDSLSTLERYSRPAGHEFYRGENMFAADVFFPRHTWWGQVIEALGGELLVNNSISGSTVFKHPEMSYPSYGCSDERTSDLGEGEDTPDVIMVLLGINDWGHGAVPISDAEGDLTVFSEAYRVMLRKLRANYPKAEIWCFTLPVSDYLGGNDGVEQLLMRRYHFGEYCEAIRRVAGELGCRTVDLYGCDVGYKTIDNYHPSAEGMRQLSEAVLCLL